LSSFSQDISFLFACDKVNIYIRSIHLPAAVDEDYFTLQELRNNYKYKIEMKDFFSCVTNSKSSDTLSSLFLDYQLDSIIIDSYYYHNYNNYILIDFMQNDTIVESVSICRFNSYFRNDDTSKFFYLRKEMLDYLQRNLVMFQIGCYE
jgi:hypothetical protein